MVGLTAEKSRDGERQQGGDRNVMCQCGTFGWGRSGGGTCRRKRCSEENDQFIFPLHAKSPRTALTCGFVRSPRVNASPSLLPHPHPSLGRVCPLPQPSVFKLRPDAPAGEWRFRKGCRRPRRPCRRSRSGRFPPARALPRGNRKLIFLIPQSSARHWRAKTNRDANL